jgi:GNAT superfamily N-acetyltransferase
VSVTVARVSASDWRIVRDIRLQALRDAPSAFASSFAREAEDDDAAWVQRVETAAWFVAREETDQWEAVGLVAGIIDRETGGPHLVSMWVDPRVRGRGVGLALVDAVKEWAASGADQLILWVADGNGSARRLYERCGFRDTGRRQPLPSDPSVGESLMSCPLTSAEPKRS